ncbi:DUF922 domain-containing protein [Aequorivita sp. H23M31]|uniref:DUF922 domain-containing protein n=1 Tax=Aequorivita ciconiae TaxID=2494375 RepID=A0A410G6K7_9FLAO|nr:DUF922 domain-containing protein [Aequorivita sp. H23M31]QAA82902.1 DUF922 domain-containing protein [Aequorivita sp. H23M31]
MKILFVFIFPFFLYFQPSSEKIYWSSDTKLTWKDFRGTPLEKARFVASTRTGIHFKYTYSINEGDIKVEFTAESFFDPQESWYIPKKVSQNVLNHEQGHFDISELHARILKKRLQAKKFTSGVKSEVEAIYLQLESERKAMQRKFDEETNHSLNLDKEKLWEERIAKQLKEYESWK